MSHAGRRTNCAHELAQTGHIRSTGYTANAVDERRKLAFVANLHGEAELKKCKKQGISGSQGLSGDRFGFPDFFILRVSGNWSTVKIGGELSGKDLIFLPADNLSSSILPLILLRVFAHPYHHLPIRIYSKSQNGGIIVTIGCYNIF